ncbi:MAG: hypothetical protein LBC20_14610 [Planctomycetaceae bacterium]|jgi:hypothetical protein|nr:hypothetical protein [Planctomycetaceae bacterium]
MTNSKSNDKKFGRATPEMYSKVLSHLIGVTKSFYDTHWIVSNLEIDPETKGALFEALSGTRMNIDQIIRDYF